MSRLETKIGNYRWLICSLIFFATMINSIERFGTKIGYAASITMWSIAEDID